MFYHALTGKGGDLEPVLLWTNSAPEAEFAAQKVSLDLTDYAGVIVEFHQSYTQAFGTRTYIKKTDGNSNGITGVGFPGDGATVALGRTISVEDSGVTFGAGVPESNNQNCVPNKIYGVKAYVVEPQIGDLLWTNPSPSTAFASQTIKIDTSGYEYIQVNTNDCNVIFNKGGALTDGIHVRPILKNNNDIVVNGTFDFGTQATENNELIPISIIGIKNIS